MIKKTAASLWKELKGHMVKSYNIRLGGHYSGRFLHKEGREVSRQILSGWVDTTQPDKGSRLRSSKKQKHL